MKLLLNIIIILHLIIFSIYSQDEIEKQKEDLKPDSQSERRMDKKWMLFVSPAPIEFPFGNTRISNRRSLQLQYNWKEYLSFGFNFMHYSEKLNENYFYPDDRNINIIDTKKDQNLLNGFIKFYPFSSLIYINLGGGRNFTGEKQSYSYINLSSTNRNDLNTINFRSQDLMPYNFTSAGFGVDWLFSNGITIGLEISKFFPIGRKINNHYLFIPLQDNINRTSLLISNLYINSRTSSEGLSSAELDSAFLRLWIGYAF